MPLPQRVPSDNGPSRPWRRVAQGFCGTHSWMGLCRAADAAKPNGWLCALGCEHRREPVVASGTALTLPGTFSWVDCSQPITASFCCSHFTCGGANNLNDEEAPSGRSTEETPEVPKEAELLLGSAAPRTSSLDLGSVTSLPILTQALVLPCSSPCASKGRYIDSWG